MATGSSAEYVNGRYEQTAEREVYRKLGDSGKWLFISKTGKWMVGSTASKDERKTKSTGWGETVAAAAGLPPTAGASVRWQVHDDGNWVEQTVQVEMLDAAAVAAQVCTAADGGRFQVC